MGHTPHLGVVDGELEHAPGVLPLGAQPHLEVGGGGDGGPVLPGAGAEPDLALDAALGNAGHQVQARSIVKKLGQAESEMGEM